MLGDLLPQPGDDDVLQARQGPGLGADWIVIGQRSLFDMTGGSRLRQLLSHRQTQGLTTAVIDVRDVYDEFSDGIEDPEGIKRFLAHALDPQTGWSPAPSFVVFVGSMNSAVSGSTPRMKVISSALPASPCIWAISYIIINQVLMILGMTVLAIIVMLYVYYRSKRAMFVPVLSSMTSAIWGLGLMSLLGYNLDPLMLVLPFLISLMTARHSMQFMSRYMEEFEITGDVK